MIPLLVLVGPTGIGKTAVAVHISTHAGGEIISMDSLQVYRGLDIGSAKPTREEQHAASHHLIDICEPEETYSAAQWAHDARRAIEDISARGKTPIIAGGTGFYLRALLQPETLAPVALDADLRAELESEAAFHGVKYLHNRLTQIDSDAANRLHPNDVRRVIRALEVALSPSATAPHMSTQAARDDAPAQDFEVLVFGLEMPREMLYARLEKRIDEMLQLGFMDELRKLINRGVPHNAPAMMGLGYKQMRMALESSQSEYLQHSSSHMSTHGAADFDSCLALWKRDTRRYAKRQMTWFRHQLQGEHAVRWISVENTSPQDVAAQIAARWREKTPGK